MKSEEIFTSKQLSSWGMLNKVKREQLIDERIEKIKSPDKIHSMKYKKFGFKN